MSGCREVFSRFNGLKLWLCAESAEPVQVLRQSWLVGSQGHQVLWFSSDLSQQLKNNSEVQHEGCWFSWEAPLLLFHVFFSTETYWCLRVRNKLVLMLRSNQREILGAYGGLGVVHQYHSMWAHRGSHLSCDALCSNRKWHYYLFRSPF